MKLIPSVVENVYRVEQSDVDWFIDVTRTIEWTEAKSYRDSVPHWYSFLGNRSPLGKQDYYRLSRVLRAVGQPRNFNRTIGINLDLDGWTYFTTDRDIEAVGNLQRGPAGKLYGKQVAPRTERAGQELMMSARDGISGVSDLLELQQARTDNLNAINAYGRRSSTAAELQEHPSTRKRAKFLMQTVGGGSYSLLDLGCGTGRLLDTNIPAKALYIGVDTSRGMLNELLMKHPKALRLKNASVEQYLNEMGDGADVVWLNLDAMPGTDPDSVRQLARERVIVESQGEFEVIK